MAIDRSRPTQLIADLDVMPLLTTRFPEIRLEDRRLGRRGNLYVLVLEDEVRCELQVALYASTREATDAFDQETRMVSYGPHASPPVVGDARNQWWSEEPTAGRLLFRRANAVLSVSQMSTERERVDLAKFLDQAMQTDTVHVKRAVGVSPPKIVKVDLPGRMSPKQEHRAAIEVEEIDPRDALIVVVGPRLVVEKKPTPVLKYVARPTPGEQRFTLVISSPGNLMSSKEVVVQVGENESDADNVGNP